MGGVRRDDKPVIDCVHDIVRYTGISRVICVGEEWAQVRAGRGAK